MSQDLTDAPSSAATAAAPAADAERRDWWRDAVIYQVYPRSFADGNGDGMGDLPGITARLPYLRDLGVDAVWLSPFYSSPQADAGYDVADYREVDPMFGTLTDADDLVRAAHALDLRVIVDLVPNHCSDQHEWFKQALREGPGSALRDRFHFRPGKGAHGELPPNDWESIFGGPAWTRTSDPDGTPGEWYLHLFAPEQPDFNWDHPAVHEEFRSVLRFWLDLGVDGFRVDVAHGLVKAAGLPDIGHAEQLALLGTAPMPYFDQDGVHEIYRGWRTILDEYPGERIAVAEAWTPTIERAALYLRPDELHQAFNFEYLGTPWEAAALRAVIDKSLTAMGSVGAPATWVLSNHDVTRHATRFANPAGLGTQLREPGDRELGLRRARAASLLMLALPGSAYLYQGEELGLPDVTDLPDEVRQDPSFFRAAGQDGFRDGCRVPIPWSGTEAPYGFGPVAGGPSWLPQPATWAELSVQAQEGDPDSTLELYRAALKLRRDHPALGAGSAVAWLDAPEGVLAFRRDGDGGEGFVCTVNLTGAPVTLPRPGRPLLSSGPVPAGATGAAGVAGGTAVTTPTSENTVAGSVSEAIRATLSRSPRTRQFGGRSDVVAFRPLASGAVTARLADIAAQAGVSEATVSRVLNGKPGVSAATRESVLAALDLLGYERPVRLRQRSAGLVGLITPELENPIFPAFAQIIGQALTRQGYTPVLATQTPGGSTEDELVEMLVERGVAGIIFVSGLHADSTADTERYARLQGQGVPFVLINGFSEKIDAPFVSPDDRGAVRLAVTHLAALGHRRIGLALGQKRFIPVQRKIEGFLASMGEVLGLAEDEAQGLVQHSLYTLEGGQAAATALITSGCTAIVCASDMMALGAIRAARQLGLSVPRDVSVVGYDDSPLIAFTDPPLTTIRQPVAAMSQAAVNALLEEIGGTPAPHSEFVFLPELVVRGSTAAAPSEPGGAASTSLPAQQPSARGSRNTSDTTDV